MPRFRVLITISFSFSIRYIVRTRLLECIKTFADPVVILTWEQPDLINELKDYEVYVLPEVKRGQKYLSVKRKLDFWHYNYCISSGSRNIEQRYLSHFKSLKSKVISKLRNKKLEFLFLFPSYKTELFKKEQQFIKDDTNYAAIENWVRQLNAQIVFTLTPFHSQEDILLHACNNLGLKMITSILSFDNITKRNRIPQQYEVYMVWNKYNEQELKEIYPITAQKKVYITGAPQFDFYFDKCFLLEKDGWLQQLMMENIWARKIILYSGGPASLFPNEPQYLQHISEAIEKGEIPGNPTILFRCHPADKIERWKKYLAGANNIIFDTSWTGERKVHNANVTENDIKKLCSTLAYTDVHVNLCSTMTLDGCAFHKPQIGPAYDEIAPSSAKDLLQMYHQQHFKPVIASGVLRIAKSRQELIDSINDALNGNFPETANAERALKEIITHADGQSKNRVLAILKQEAQN